MTHQALQTKKDRGLQKYGALLALCLPLALIAPDTYGQIQFVEAPYDTAFVQNGDDMPDVIISGIAAGDKVVTKLFLNKTSKPASGAIDITKLDPQSDYCFNSEIKIAFQSASSFNPGNTFTAQLSDKDGDFTNATDIGSINSTSSSGVIDAVINTTVTSGKYRIRVVSSAPLIIGDDNGADLNIAGGIDLSKFSATASDSVICEGDSVTLSSAYHGGKIVSPFYIWDNGVSNGKAFAPDKTMTYTLIAGPGPGTYKDGKCSTIRRVTITVNPRPTVTATAQPKAVCADAETQTTVTASGASTYIWSPHIDNGVPFIPTTTQTYSVTGTDANGCSDTASVTVTVLPLPTVTATANPGTDICEGHEVTLNGGGADTYSWDKNVTDGKAFVPTQTETYTVTGTDVNGCENTTGITVHVKDTSIVAVADTICSGGTYTFGTQTLDKAGTYTEVFVAANGCDSTVNLDLTVNTADASITRNGKELKATAGATSYQWINCQDNQPIAGATNQTYTSKDAGDFAVVVTNGDCTDTSVCYHLEGEHAGISGVSFSHQATLYPNPNSGQMTITSGYTLANATARVINVVGQTVKEINHISGNSFKIDVHQYAAGIYYVEIRDGAQTARVKFTKK